MTSLKSTIRSRSLTLLPPNPHPAIRVDQSQIPFIIIEESGLGYGWILPPQGHLPKKHGQPSRVAEGVATLTHPYKMPICGALSRTHFAWNQFAQLWSAWPEFRSHMKSSWTFFFLLCHIAPSSSHVTWMCVCERDGARGEAQESAWHSWAHFHGRTLYAMFPRSCLNVQIVLFHAKKTPSCSPKKRSLTLLYEFKSFKVSASWWKKTFIQKIREICAPEIKDVI